MRQNNIITAIQVDDFTGLEKEWKSLYPAESVDFYSFMTTPSAERDVFISTFKAENSSRKVEYDVHGCVAAQTII